MTSSCRFDLWPPSYYSLCNVVGRGMQACFTVARVACLFWIANANNKCKFESSNLISVAAWKWIINYVSSFCSSCPSLSSFCLPALDLLQSRIAHADMKNKSATTWLRLQECLVFFLWMRLLLLRVLASVFGNILRCFHCVSEWKHSFIPIWWETQSGPVVKIRSGAVTGLTLALSMDGRATSDENQGRSLNQGRNFAGMQLHIPFGIHFTWEYLSYL